MAILVFGMTYQARTDAWYAEAHLFKNDRYDADQARILARQGRHTRVGYPEAESYVNPHFRR